MTNEEMAKLVAKLAESSVPEKHEFLERINAALGIKPLRNRAQRDYHASLSGLVPRHE